MASCSFTQADLIVRVTGASNHKGVVTGDVFIAEMRRNGTVFAMRARKAESTPLTRLR